MRDSATTPSSSPDCSARRPARRSADRVDGARTTTVWPRRRSASATPATCSFVGCGTDHAWGVTRQRWSVTALDCRSPASQGRAGLRSAHDRGDDHRPAEQACKVTGPITVVDVEGASSRFRRARPSCCAAVTRRRSRSARRTSGSGSSPTTCRRESTGASPIGRRCRVAPCPRRGSNTESASHPPPTAGSSSTCGMPSGGGRRRSARAAGSRPASTSSRSSGSTSPSSSRASPTVSTTPSRSKELPRAVR